MTLDEAEDQAMEGRVPEYLDMYSLEAREGRVQLYGWHILTSL
jgi:hypothetical protein